MGLHDMPPYRQMALVWRYLLEYTVGEIDAMIRAAEGKTCRSYRFAGCGTYTCQRGDDGRHHLLCNNIPVCAVMPSRRRRATQPPGSWRHSQSCLSWTDGTRYRVQAPPEAWDRETRALVVGVSRRIEVTWQVTLIGEPTDPGLVRSRHRCPIPADWPGYQGIDRPGGRERARLVAELGAQCHLCQQSPGAILDHDHFTGLIRGLLCIGCNNNLEECLHVTGCPRADYLNAPPAARLRLYYPQPDRLAKHDKELRRIAYLGFDPRFQPASRRLPKTVRELPPPPAGTGIDLTAVSEQPLF
ncbi:endonuclease [Actinoplanes sp. N902-109]|uniref:endonuclease n=1 Tax=Actinoplanes sp. (strain N902-109) TaxID=649831 RepID=UPI00032941BA|nr:endonuclease [Actinoplanes sp. N902-109]AGL13724.1 endonuclease [Actinoplanes sp. N902-109]